VIRRPRIERRSAVEIADQAGEPELRHFDPIAGLAEHQRMPLSIPRMNFHEKVARLDDHDIEIARRLAIAPQLEPNLARVFEGDNISATSRNSCAYNS